MAKKKTAKKAAKKATKKASKPETKTTVSKPDHAKASAKMPKAPQKKQNNGIIAAVILVVLLIVAAIFAITAFTPNEANSDSVASASGLTIILTPTDSELTVAVEKTGDSIEILESEITYLTELFKTNGIVPSRTDIIQEAVVRQILLDNSQGIEVDSSILEDLKTNPQFIESVEQNNFTVEEFLETFGEELEKDLIIQEFFNTKITAQIPTDNAYETSHILICHAESQVCVQNRTKEEALNIATGIAIDIKNVNTAEYFAEKAIASSDGPSAQNGGYLGPVVSGMMVPEFEAATFALQPGDISEVVETQFGFHVIRVNQIIQTPNQQAIVETLTELRNQIVANAEITDNVITEQ